jgi:hypothetical protein
VVEVSPWPAALAMARMSAAQPEAAADSPLFPFFSCSSPSSLAPHLARSREQPCGQREDGGRRRRWPPRRCVRSPEGERAAVERLSDGARGPVPHASERQRSGERSTRPVRRHSAHQGGAGGGDSKVRPW